MISSNNFSKDRPVKSTNSFTENMPQASTNSFSDAKPQKDDEIFEGDNTSGASLGGDFETFGDIYGDSFYTKRLHFKNRQGNTPSHT